MSESQPSRGAEPVGLRVEGRIEPLGLDVAQPRFTWRLGAGAWFPAGRGAQGPDGFRIELVGPREERASVAVDGACLDWTGAPVALRSLASYAWRVGAVYGDDVRWSAWTRWTTGLLAPDRWTAPWLRAPRWACGATPLEKFATGSPRASFDGTHFELGPADPWMRAAFELPAAPERALLLVASIGYHAVYVNGVEVAPNERLAPHLSDLRRRVRYRTYSVGALVGAGRNAVGVWLSAGWSAFDALGGERGPLLSAQLWVEERMPAARTDALQVGDASDSADTSELQRCWVELPWRTHPSPTAHRGLYTMRDYGGEHAEGLAAECAWSAADFDAAQWAVPERVELDLCVTADRVEPDVLQDAWEAVCVEPAGDHGWRADAGRAFHGVFEVDIEAEPGQLVELSVSERVERACSFGQTSSVVVGASGRARFAPRFHTAGGRWLTVRGAATRPEPSEVRARLLSTGVEPISSFRCSDELLNRIYATGLWTLRSLMSGGYIADCPHREKWGYGGDAHATVPTAARSFRIEALLRQWLEDWRDVQRADGSLPHSAPTLAGSGGPAWGGCIVFLSWEGYWSTGDPRFLTDSREAMERYVEFLWAQVRAGLLHPYGGVGGFFGDWVPPLRGQHADEWIDAESTLFFNNAWFVLLLRRYLRILNELGEQSALWSGRAQELGAAVHRRFYDASRASYACGEQPYLALALASGIVPEPERERVAARLEERICGARRGHVNAGILGTWVLLEALRDRGRNDLIYRMATQRTFPSWGRMLERGATTFWEEWDGENSRLHASFLSLGAWFFDGLAGIRATSAGYRSVHVQPLIAAGLDSMEASLGVPQGRIDVRWRRLPGGVSELRVGLPPGTAGTVGFGGAGDRTLGPGESVFVAEAPEATP